MLKATLTKCFVFKILGDIQNSQLWQLSLNQRLLQVHLKPHPLPKFLNDESKKLKVTHLIINLCLKKTIGQYGHFSYAWFMAKKGNLSIYELSNKGKLETHIMSDRFETCMLSLFRVPSVTLVTRCVFVYWSVLGGDTAHHSYGSREHWPTLKSKSCLLPRPGCFLQS